MTVADPRGAAHDTDATILAQFSALMSISEMFDYGALSPAVLRALVAAGLDTPIGARLLAEYQARRETMTTAQALDGLEVPHG